MENRITSNGKAPQGSSKTNARGGRRKVRFNFPKVNPPKSAIHAADFITTMSLIVAVMLITIVASGGNFNV